MMTQQVRYRVGVLFGGRSSEHAVSLASARTVMHALRQAGHLWKVQKLRFEAANT